MSLLRLAYANLRASPLSSLVNLLLLALGTASIALLLLVGDLLSSTLSRDARGIDLVLGAKGSPLQLVLSSVYHADIPVGNIAQADAERWATDARVALAVPLALGDSYRGFRIVGTNTQYAALYQARLASGRSWVAPMEAILGADVAAETALREGARFAGAHGLVGNGEAHAGHPYRVVGVLQPTGSVLDRLILTSLNSVWQLHEAHAEHEAAEHDEDAPASAPPDAPPDAHTRAHHPDPAAEADRHRDITAMLLRYASPMAALSLPREINAASALQAAAPAFEISRLLNLVGLGLDGLRAFAIMLMLSAGLSLFASLYSALRARRHDLAMLRCLGASRLELLLSLLLEGLILTLLGAAAGFALAHGTLALLGHWLSSSHSITISGWLWLESESLLLASLLGVGLLAAGLPAWQAYRTDVARILSEA